MQTELPLSKRKFLYCKTLRTHWMYRMSRFDNKRNYLVNVRITTHSAPALTSKISVCLSDLHMPKLHMLTSAFRVNSYTCHTVIGECDIKKDKNRKNAVKWAVRT